MNLNNFYLEGINPIRGLDESVVISRIEAGERGYFAMLQWTYRWIEKTHPMVRAVKRRLLSSLGGLEWNIKLADTGDDAEKKAMAERQEKTLRSAYDAIANLESALKFLALGELRGFSHLEKIYAGAINQKTGKPFDADLDAWDVVELRIVEQWFWAKRGFYGPWLYNRTAKETNEGESIDLAHYVIHTVDDPADEIFARLTSKHIVNDNDWTGFLFDYGIPPMFIILPPNIPKERETEYQRAAELAVSAARGSLPNGASLATPNATGSGGAGVFHERLKYIDEQIVIAGTSGKLTVISESGSGTLAGGAQKEAFDEIAQAIADQLSGVLREQFDRPLLAKKHKGEPVLARFEYAKVDVKDAKGVLTDAKTASDAGYEISEEEISEKSGYKLTRKVPVQQQNGQSSPPTPPAAPEAATATTPADRAANAVADDLHLTSQFVAPAMGVIDALLSDARSGEVSNEQLLARAEEFLERIPEIAETSDVTEIAAALEKALTAAAEQTLFGK